MDTVTRDGAMEYGWSNVSSLGNPNGVRMYDRGSDGRPDWLYAFLVVKDVPKNSTTESLQLAVDLIKVAGGTTEAAEVIRPWIAKAALNGGDTRHFGSVDVQVTFTKATDGGMLMLTIGGTEERRVPALGKPTIGSKVAPAPDPAHASAPATKKSLLPKPFIDGMASQQAAYDAMLTDIVRIRALPDEEQRAAIAKAYGQVESLTHDECKLKTGLPEPFFVRGNVRDRTENTILLAGTAVPNNNPAMNPMGTVVKDASVVVRNPSVEVAVGFYYTGTHYFIERKEGKNAFGGTVPVWVYGDLTVEQQAASTEANAEIERVAKTSVLVQNQLRELLDEIRKRKNGVVSPIVPAPSGDRSTEDNSTGATQ
jgi:hypothetical protein